jgi:hypothetical protein
MIWKLINVYYEEWELETGIALENKAKHVDTDTAYEGFISFLESYY